MPSNSFSLSRKYRNWSSTLFVASLMGNYSSTVDCVHPDAQRRREFDMTDVGGFLRGGSLMVEPIPIDAAPAALRDREQENLETRHVVEEMRALAGCDIVIGQR